MRRRGPRPRREAGAPISRTYPGVRAKRSEARSEASGSRLRDVSQAGLATGSRCAPGRARAFAQVDLRRLPGRRARQEVQDRKLPARVPAVAITLAWVGDRAPRMEVAHVELRGRELTAVGTQLGAAYELRYRLERGLLQLELVGERSLELALGDVDFFDLGWSPLFNSLPVVRDRLLEPGRARDYVMQWVDVPSLEVTRSEQRYEPLGSRSSASALTASRPTLSSMSRGSSSTIRASPGGRRCWMPDVARDGSSRPSLSSAHAERVCAFGKMSVR